MVASKLESERSFSSSRGSLSSILSLGSLVELMGKCLEQMDMDGRRNARDEWTSVFEKFKQSKSLDVPKQDDRVVILCFLHSLPVVSRIHLRQAEFEIAKLFQGADGELWLDTAHGLLSPRSPDIHSGKPVQNCFEKRGPLHTAYVVHKGKVPSSRSRECLSLILFIATLISVAALIVYVSKKSGLLCHWWSSVLQTSLPSLVCLLAIAVLSILVFLAILVGLCRAALRVLSMTAALSTMTIGIFLIAGIAFLTNSFFASYFQKEYQIYKELLVACTLPWNILVVANAHRLLAQLSEWLVSSMLKLWSHITISCCRRDAAVYSHLTLETQLRGVGKVTYKIDKLVKNDANQALLEAEMTDIMKWATLLKNIVHEDERYRFDADNYQELVYSLHRDEKATLADLCIFFAWRFISAFCNVIVRSFRRNRELSRGMRGVKNAIVGATELAQPTWRVLLDQYDWYSKCGYCFTDIMAWIAGHDNRAVRVVGLLKVVDDTMAWWLCLFCQSPLFTPAPEERETELALRLEVVNALVDGRYT